MSKFSVGDHVSWNSEAGRVSARLSKFVMRILTIRVIGIAPRRMTRNMKLKATRSITSPLTRKLR